MVKAPIKFGSEESLAETAGGVPSADPKRDHSKSPGPDLATTPTVGPSLEFSRSSGVSAQRADVVTPAAPVSHAPSPSSTSGGAAAAAGAKSATVAPASSVVDGATAAAAPVSAVSPAATASSAARCGTAAQRQAMPSKRKPAATAVGSKRNIRTIRFRGGGYPSASGALPTPPPAGAVGAAAAAATAAAPLSREIQTNAATSDSLAGAAVAAGAGTGAGAGARAGAVTSPKESMSTAAAVAKRTVDSLFDTAALKLSAAPTPKAAAASAAKAKVTGGRKQKSPAAVGKGAVVPAGAARDSKPKAEPATAAPAVVAQPLLPFGAEVTDGVTARDVFEAASSRSWVGGGGAAEEGPRGALTGVLATAQVLMEKVRTKPVLLFLSCVVEQIRSFLLVCAVD